MIAVMADIIGASDDFDGDRLEDRAYFRPSFLREP
jgi:hypothetical protein